MDSTQARNDLEVVKAIVQRASQRIDAHGFHSVHWGVIVLIWFPLANWYQLQGNATGYLWSGIAALTLGAGLSIWRGITMGCRPRLPGGNTFVSSQIAWIAGGNLVAGGALSVLAPMTDFIHGTNVPVIWGLIYANMAFMMGVAYCKDYLISGICIFIGCALSILFQQYSGYILGPFMGLGMIIPGARAEARVRRFLSDSPEANAAEA